MADGFCNNWFQFVILWCSYFIITYTDFIYLADSFLLFDSAPLHLLSPNHQLTLCRIELEDALDALLRDQILDRERVW